MAPNPKNEKFTTPVLMVIFNRPDTTRQVFEAVRKIKPPRLYIAADGPREEVFSDRVKCQETRAIVQKVDWDCEVKTLFQKQNLNCGRGPATAFSWFFEHETEGIILEDDCLPSESFFWFCQELLLRYRHDSRIMHIGGNNFLSDWQHDPDYSYYFSQSGYIWGWATWRRAWRRFDFEIKSYEEIKSKGYFDKFFLHPLERFYRLRKFDQTAANRGNIDWWDYQWDYARFVHSGLAIVPQRNLVRNLGFGEGATHTTNHKSNSADMKAMEIAFPLKHPPHVIRDAASDSRYFKGLMKDTLFSKLKVLA